MTTKENSEATFTSLGLRPELVRVLEDLGYEAPTPIQARTIPVLLQGGDLIGQAQTGTGKTAAFALPILQSLDPAKKETQALVLAPTRELAMQVAEAIHTYARDIGEINVLPVYGGAPIVLQMKHLQRGAHVVVGTPGRLIDHLDRGTLRLGAVKMLILDEADEMLKMGFIEEVERILSQVPKPRQVALFSATMPDEVRKIAQRHLSNPVRVEIEHRAQTTPAIEQRFINLSEGQKLDVLTQILELEPPEAALIFRRTKTGAAELAEKLQARGFAAVAMHGDMTQPLRENVIRRLRAGQIEIVVATDVAARGLDVEQISHVINYDIPYDVEAYVHRIGRTGRAGRSGVATLFITPRERRMMREIERFTGSSMKPMKMPTPADVAKKRIGVFKESLRKNLMEGDLDLYVGLVEQLADEGPFDMAEVAAAAARLANGSRSLAPVAEASIWKASAEAAAGKAPRVTAPRPMDDTADSKPPRAAARKSAVRPEKFDDEVSDERERKAPAERAERTSTPRPAGSKRVASSEPKVRLSIGVGSRDGIRPGDIVGSIANEADIPGSDIGPIDIREDVTIVVIPEKYRDLVLEKVAGARFRGRDLNIQVADGTEGPRYKASGGDDDRPPRRDAKPRPPYRADAPPSRGARTDRPAPRFVPGGGSFKPRGAAGKPAYDRPSRGATAAPPRYGASDSPRPAGRPFSGPPFKARSTGGKPSYGKPAAAGGARFGKTAGGAKKTGPGGKGKKPFK